MKNCMWNKITQEGENLLITKNKDRIVIRIRDLLRNCMEACPEFPNCEGQLEEMIGHLSPKKK